MIWLFRILFVSTWAFILTNALSSSVSVSGSKYGNLSEADEITSGNAEQDVPDSPALDFDNNAFDGVVLSAKKHFFSTYSINSTCETTHIDIIGKVVDVFSLDLPPPFYRS